MTLYTQVAANRTKTWLFMLVYIALLLGIGYLISWYYGSDLFFILAAIISIGQGFISYRYSDRIALAVSRAVPLPQNEYPEIYRLVQNLAITAGLPLPRLYIINEPAMNAFATGRDPQHAALALTRGLVERLDSNELQGVIAHELSHVGNEDIRLTSMVAIMAGMVALLSHWFTNSLWWGGGRRSNEEGEGGGILLLVGIALAILAPLVATLIQLAISRRREFMADASGVLLTRYPEGLISALRKISGDDTPLPEANSATAHMYFTNPLKSQWLASLFSTHPPVEARIRALEEGSGARE